MPDYKKDGDLVFGSQALTIGGVPGFIVDNLTVTRPVRLISVPNASAVAERQLFIREAAQGSAVLQLPTSTTAAPARGTLMSIGNLGSGGATWTDFLITNVGEQYTAGGATKVIIDIQQALNGVAIPSAIKVDGDFTDQLPSGPVRLSYDSIYGSYSIRQRFTVNAANYSAISLGTLYTGSPGYRFIEDSEPQEVPGTPLVTFERTFCTVPGSRVEYGTVQKTIKTLIQQWYPLGSPPSMTRVSANVSSRTQGRKSTLTYTYTTNPGSLSLSSSAYQVPDVSGAGVYPYVSIDAVNGFPVSGAPGFSSNLVATYNTNDYEHFISADLRRWRGDIWELVVVKA